MNHSHPTVNSHKPSRRRHRRIPLVGVLAAAVVAVGAMLVPVAPVGATTMALAMQCNSHEINVVFDPPLTHAGQEFSNAVVTSSLSGCVPTDPVFAGTTSGNFENGRLSGTVEICVGPEAILRANGTGRWVFNNGVQGVFPFTVNPPPDPPNGIFTSGPAKDYTGFHRTLTTPIWNGLCETGGLTAVKTQGTADFQTPA